MGKFFTVELKKDNKWEAVNDNYKFTYGDLFRVHMADDVKLKPFAGITGTIIRGASISITGAASFTEHSSALLLSDFNGAYFPSESGTVINNTTAIKEGDGLKIEFTTTAKYSSWADWISGNPNQEFEEKQTNQHKVTFGEDYGFTVVGAFKATNLWNGTDLIDTEQSVNPMADTLQAVTHNEYANKNVSEIRYTLNSCEIDSAAAWANSINITSIKMVFPEVEKSLNTNTKRDTGLIKIQPLNGEYKCTLRIVTDDKSSGAYKTYEESFTPFGSSLVVAPPPTFTLNGAISRCGSDGKPAPVAADNTYLDCSSLSYPTSYAPIITARVREHGTSTWGEKINVVDGLFDAHADSTKDYDVELTFTDAFERTRQLTVVAGKNEHSTENQVMLAYKDNKTVEFFWPLLLTGGIRPVSHNGGTAALNEYHTPGIYYLSDTTISETLTDSELDYRTCLLIVTGSDDTMYQLAVILTDSATNKLELRSLTHANDAWTPSTIWVI